MTAVRLTAYAPNGASLGPLPSPQDVSVSYPLNDLGALQFSYAVNAPRVGILGQPLEVAVEVTHDLGATWQEPPSSRFLYYRDGRDPVKTADAWAVEGAPYILRLEKAVVGFGSLSVDGVRVFTSANPGAILGTLFDEARNRGALEGMARTWTATTDSSGRTWPESINSLSLEPGKNLLSVLQDLAAMGLVDFRTSGRNVDLFVAESPTGMGADRTIEATPVVLRAGRDLLEAPFRRTWEALADTAIVHGDNGVNVTRTNAAAVKPWGRQETYATASGVTDTGTLNVVGDTVLEGMADQRTEHTFGLDFRKTPHYPLRDYGPGEWVYAMTETESGNQVTRFRVMQVTLTKGQDGRAAGNVVLNDRFIHGDVRNARKLDRLLKGATTSGTGVPPSTSPGGNDILAPAKVGTLTTSTSTYVNSEGRNRAQVTLDWPDVTQSADGTAVTDVDHYEIWRLATDVGGWQMVGTTAPSIFYSSDYEPSSAWQFKVRAVDSAWNRGAFSDAHAVTMPKDSVPPPRPSMPTVATRLGVATVAWDGLAETNPAQGMGLDYAFTEYHVSATNNTNQDPSLTRIGDTRGQGTAVSGPLAYATTHYAWVVAVDDNGNRSQASPVRSFAVAALVDVSNFPDDAMDTLYARTAHFITVTSDMIAANQIQTMHLDAGAVTTDKLAVYSRKPSVLPNSWMEVQHPTVPTRPAAWDVWYPTGTTPTLSKNTASPIQGSTSLRVTGDATTGYVVGSDNGNWLPVLPGQTWTIRGHFRSTVTVPAGKSVRLRFDTAAPGVNPIGFTGDRVSHFVTLTGPLAAGSTFLLEDTFTVPANHTQAAVSVQADVMGVAFGHDWDGVELAPGVSSADVTTIGAGKISTGILQAATRIIAGAEGGARTEMTGTGWAAYAADGSTKTFEVKASDGSVFTSGTFTTMASAGTGRVQISAVQNPYETNQTWNTIQFFSANTAWAPGLVWAAYGSGSPNWGALQLAGPRLGSRQPARLTLRSEEQTNETAIHLTANTIRATADNYHWGDPTTGVTSFWLAPASSGFQRFNFLSAGGNRMQFRYETLGVNFLASLEDATTLSGLGFRGRDFRWEIQGASTDLFLWSASEASNRPILFGVGMNAGLVFGNGDLHVKSANGAVFQPILASAFTVNSDARRKENVLEAPRSLEVVESVPVYTYNVIGTEDPQIGLMAQDLKTYLPEAVRVTEEGDLGVSMYHLTATNWGAIQDLTAEVRDLAETVRRMNDVTR